MSGREIIIWIIVFVIGSLIVTFLVNPNSFSNLKDNIKNLRIKTTQNSTLSNQQVIKLVPSQMQEYSVFAGLYKSCASLEANAEASGITNIKEKACREACGKRNMDYYSSDCEKDLLICYCKL